MHVYYAYIHSRLSYGTLIWGDHSSALLFNLQKKKISLTNSRRNKWRLVRGNELCLIHGSLASAGIQTLDSKVTFGMRDELLAATT